MACLWEGVAIAHALLRSSNKNENTGKKICSKAFFLLLDSNWLCFFLLCYRIVLSCMNLKYLHHISTHTSHSREARLHHPWILSARKDEAAPRQACQVHTIRCRWHIPFPRSLVRTSVATWNDRGAPFITFSQGSLLMMGEFCPSNNGELQEKTDIEFYIEFILRNVDILSIRHQIKIVVVVVYTF